MVDDGLAIVALCYVDLDVLAGASSQVVPPTVIGRTLLIHALVSLLKARDVTGDVHHGLLVKALMAVVRFSGVPSGQRIALQSVLSSENVYDMATQ